MPHFQKFDGKKGYSHEYCPIYALLGLLDSIQNFLPEFFKSLTDRAYTWYVNLLSWLVHDWENLVSLFHALHILAKFTLAELRCIRQHCEDPEMYMNIFHERAVYYYDLTSRKTLADLCLQEISEEYHV